MRLDCRGLGSSGSRGRVVVAVALLIGIGLLLLVAGTDVGGARITNEATARPKFPAFHSAASARDSQHLLAAYGQLPLIFERNRGQSDPRVIFLARGSGYGLFLTAGEAVLALQHSSAVDNQHSAPGTAVVRMALAGGNANALVNGTDELPGKSNYFIGNEPAEWHRDIPQFARVRYHSVYPGIDLVYHGNQGRLEYDFEIAPGRNPKQVVLRFQGPEKLRIDADGNLVLTIDGGEVRL